MLRLVFVTGIVLTTTAAQSVEHVFNTRIYVTPPRAVIGETLTLECEGYLDLTATDFYIPGMKYEGSKRLSLFRRLSNGSAIEVAERTANDKNPQILDEAFEGATTWSFFHKTRVQQLKVTIRDVQCQFTGAYWCESSILVNGGIVQHKSQPRDFTIYDCEMNNMNRLEVYPVLGINPHSMSLTEVGATLKLNCSLNVNRPNHKERVSRYAITFYGEEIASLTTDNKITISERYKARQVKVKGKANYYPHYLDVTLPDLRCTDLGAFRCTVWAFNEFREVMTVSDLKELRQTGDRNLKNYAYQCPLQMDKSPKVLKPDLPFTLTCSAVVLGLSTVGTIPNVKSITMRRTTLEAKDVVVAVVDKTGSTAFTNVPGEKAYGVISSAYVVSLEYSVLRAGCNHVGTYWCSAIVGDKTKEGPRSFIGFPCRSSKLDGAKDDDQGGSKDGSEGPDKGSAPHLILSVDMVDEAQTKNALQVQCVVSSRNIKQMDKANVYLNDQEIISTKEGKVLTARDEFYMEEPTRTESTVRHLPTGAWVGLDLAITPFSCSLAGLFSCKMQLTTKDGGTLELNATKLNTPPFPENFKEIKTKVHLGVDHDTVNCSGVLEPPNTSFKLLHRHISGGSWMRESHIIRQQTSLNRNSGCWFEGYEIFDLNKSSDKMWKCT